MSSSTDTTGPSPASWGRHAPSRITQTLPSRGKLRRLSGREAQSGPCGGRGHPSQMPADWERLSSLSMQADGTGTPLHIRAVLHCSPNLNWVRIECCLFLNWEPDISSGVLRPWPCANVCHAVSRPQRIMATMALFGQRRVRRGRATSTLWHALCGWGGLAHPRLLETPTHVRPESRTAIRQSGLPSERGIR
jgi:hypothetical protein